MIFKYKIVIQDWSIIFARFTLSGKACYISSRPSSLRLASVPTVKQCSWENHLYLPGIIRLRADIINIDFKTFAVNCLLINKIDFKP